MYCLSDGSKLINKHVTQFNWILEWFDDENTLIKKCIYMKKDINGILVPENETVGG